MTDEEWFEKPIRITRALPGARDRSVRRRPRLRARGTRAHRLRAFREFAETVLRRADRAAAHPVHTPLIDRANEPGRWRRPGPARQNGGHTQHRLAYRQSR